MSATPNVLAMLATQYSYTIEQESSKMTIILTQLASGRTKEFIAMGRSFEAYTIFMENMSDDACLCFFPEERKPKEKKQK